MIHPVRAAILTPEWAKRVIAPPHETLTPKLRSRLMEQNPDSFLHVTAEPGFDNASGVDNASVDSASATHPSGQQRTAKQVAEALQKLLAAGAYSAKTEPSLFVQRIAAVGRVQHSLIGAVQTSPSEHKLLPHEDTHSARVYGLAASFGEVAQMWSPVVAASPDAAGLKEIIAATGAGSDAGSTGADPASADPAGADPAGHSDRSEPVLHTETADGATITLWRVDPQESATSAALAELSTSLCDGKSLYIIDGHHRVAAARRAGFKRVLIALVPPEELVLAGFDRLVSDIDVMPRRLLDTLAQHCELTQVADERAAIPTEAGRLGIGIGASEANYWYTAKRLDLPTTTKPKPAAMLDAEFIHAQLLPALFGITDASAPNLSYRPSLLATNPAGSASNTAPATSSPVSVSSPAPADSSPVSADPASDSGVFTILTAPVPAQTVFAVANMGKTMPPKSTYLVPKVRAGAMLVEC